MANPISNFVAVLAARVTDPFRGGGLRWLSGVVLLFLLPLGFALAYQRWGHLVGQSELYTITADDIQVSPQQPAWIHGNVKAEVVRDGSLKDLKSLDTSLSGKIIDAFELHPWVAEVTRLSKSYPNVIKIKLAYRRPVAMVEVIDQGRRGVSPVDKEGFVLPIDGFLNNLDKKENYLRLLAAPNMSPALEGTLWRDTRIKGGAQVANAVGEYWKAWGLYRIVVVPGSGSEPSSEPAFVFETTTGAQVVWGRAPGEEGLTEPKAATKLTMLRTYTSENGPLSKLPVGAVIDLRIEGPLTPRTAKRSTDLGR